MVVNEANYLQVMNDICGQLDKLMSFFNEAKDINYYDTQEVIVFQDKLNAYSVEYKQDYVTRKYNEYYRILQNWEFSKNTPEIRKLVVKGLTLEFEHRQKTGEIDAYQITCDETNNWPTMLDNGEGAIRLAVLLKGHTNPIIIDHIFELKNNGN